MIQRRIRAPPVAIRMDQRLSPVTAPIPRADPILIAGHMIDAQWGQAPAAAEFAFGKGSVVVCQVKLAGRITPNPPAATFAARLFGLHGG